MKKQEYINQIETKYNELEKNNGKGNQLFWTYTNYPADFNENIKNAYIFSEWKNSLQTQNLENYFKSRASYYKLARGSEEHRRLIIDKLYGIITSKVSSGYDKEETTQIYDEILKAKDNEDLINLIKTEQILKVKMNPIAGGAKIIERSIYPVIFTYQVLRKLLDKDIDKISLKDFYLIICTQCRHEDADECVNILCDKTPCSYPEVFTERFLADKNRILGIFDNINLFKYQQEDGTNYILLNTKLIEIMDKFLHENDWIFEKLNNIDDYKKFLCTYQHFNICLLGDGNEIVIIDETDSDYIEEINSASISFSESDVDKMKDDYHRDIEFTETSSGKKIKCNPKYGIAALQMYEYKCCIDSSHTTFTSKTSKNSYMEGHHLIPRKFQQKYYSDFKVNIDCIQNIVSLCPNCHRALHYGILSEKEELLKVLFDLKKDELRTLNPNISLEDLISYYK